MTNIAQAPGKCFSPTLALQYATMLKCCNGLSFAGGNIKDKHCFRVWRFEWQNVGLKKTFCQILFFFFPEIMSGIDSCIAKNHFTIELGIHFLASVPISICGSKILMNSYLQQLYMVTVVDIRKMALNDFHLLVCTPSVD